MATFSETGHAKNLAKFDELVSFLNAFGTSYNPSNPSLNIRALQALSADSRKTLTTLNEQLALYGNAIAAREVNFKPLNKLITRIMNAMKAIKTTQQVDDNARTLVRKIQGIRSSAKKTEEEKKALAAEGSETKEISSSQMSFDARLENFDKLIKLLASIPEYEPNEEDLKISALTKLYAALQAKNTSVVNAAVLVSNSRLSRNNITYKPDSGLVDIAFGVKSYIKSIYGGTSPEFKQVSKLAFTVIK